MRDEKEKYIPIIDVEYTVLYREDNRVKEMYFTVYEDSDLEDDVFGRALKFAQAKDTILFYSEPFGDYFDPRTGMIVQTPAHSGKDYYLQPMQPYENPFTAIDPDDLPF